MIETIARHSQIALQFSGGKDSLACLFVMRPYWDRLAVYWVNTGAAFPETIALMDEVRAMVPRFVEIRSDQPADLIENGYPVDLLPTWNAREVMPYVGESRVRLQAFLACCFRNVMAPMQARMIEDGVTLVIRGQRTQEAAKSTVRSGAVDAGVEYLFPIEDWSGEDVRAYLADKPISLPENYADMDTSLDCWSCTAYLKDNIGKRRYMKRRHPEMYRVVSERLAVISRETQREVDNLTLAMEA